VSPAIAEPPRLFRESARPFDSEDAPRRPLTRSDGGRLTLEQKLDRVWEGLHAAGAVECPMCRSRMTRSGDVARCDGCGSTLH
jgi:ribosomal protein S27E